MDQRSTLGHLVRTYRYKASLNPEVTIPSRELLTLVDAADIGLYWSVEAPLEINACEEQTRQVIHERETIKKERDNLRKEYCKDKEEIRELGFTALEDLLAYVRRIKDEPF